MKIRRRHGVAGLAAVLLGLAVAVPPALATFHEMNIREVYPGSVAQPNAEYVELQMWAPGQNLVGGHTMVFYDSTGKIIGSAKFSADVSGAANQSTILIATPEAESAFGVVADLGLSPGLIDPAGGAICWEELDCVAWGNYSGSKLDVGSPATPAGIPDGKALRRSIAAGCASLLEPTDDTDNSAADFEPVFPAPRPNSVTPTEKSCGGGGSGGGGGGGGGVGNKKGAPQTTLRKKPAKSSADRTATFRFSADEKGVAFQCKVDGGRYKTCLSPFTTKKLSFGSHAFSVRAKDSSGQLDPTPAQFRFKVVRRG